MFEEIKENWKKKSKWEKATYIGMYILICSTFFVSFINELAGFIGIIAGAIIMVSCGFVWMGKE